MSTRPLITKQTGKAAVAGDASSTFQLSPPSVDRISPHRRVRASTNAMTTFCGFSGSTAMDGDVYVRAGSTSPFVAWTGWVSRCPLGAAETAPAPSKASVDPSNPAAATRRRARVDGLKQARVNIADDPPVSAADEVSRPRWPGERPRKRLASRRKNGGAHRRRGSPSTPVKLGTNVVVIHSGGEVPVGRQPRVLDVVRWAIAGALHRDPGGRGGRGDWKPRYGPPSEWARGRAPRLRLQSPARYVEATSWTSHPTHVGGRLASSYSLP